MPKWHLSRSSFSLISNLFMLIDLSHTLNEDTPVYPGDPRMKLNKSGALDKDDYEDYFISMPTHMGTHIDAPAHMLKGGKKITELPIEHFSGRGVCINATSRFS